MKVVKRYKAKLVKMHKADENVGKYQTKVHKLSADVTPKGIVSMPEIRRRFIQLSNDIWRELYLGIELEEQVSDFFLEFLSFLDRFSVEKVDQKHYKISGLFTKEFVNDVTRYINKGSKLLKIFEIITEQKLLVFKKTYVVIHEFFIPDLYAILLDLFAKTGKKKYAVQAIQLKKQTWLKIIDNPKVKTKLYWSRLKDIKWSLKSFQEEFIRKYPILKDRLDLRGYILAFDQGLGKTFTSLVLMHLLRKDLVIILCPKTLMFNWKNEIKNIFKKPPKDSEIFLVGESTKLLPSTKYIISNYERIEEIQSLLAKLPSKNIGVIVDESQNFRNIKAKRTQSLMMLIKNYETKINDVLLLSGTPIKSNYAELAPYLYIIDPRFDNEALEKWLKVFNVDMSIASDIIRYRLSLIAYRKLKNEVLQLPEKKHIELPVTVPNIEEYTLEHFKEVVQERAAKLFEQYESQFDKYFQQFLSVLDEIKTLAIKNGKTELAKEIDFYRSYVEQTEKGKLFEKIEDKQLVDRLRQIEHDIETFLSDIKEYELKKKFKNLKTIVTRITYRVYGKAFGDTLHELRAKMVYDIFRYNIDKVCKIIQDSTKTVIFTYSTSVIPKLKQLIEQHCKVGVVTITGATKDRGSVIKKFKTDSKIKVIIASYQVASVGLTLTEADTMIYADKPYREADLKQAEDRIYRIGQDKPVKIIYLKLKTDKKTLQERIDEIVKYFGSIVNLVMDTGGKRNANL